MKNETERYVGILRSLQGPQREKLLQVLREGNIEITGSLAPKEELERIYKNRLKVLKTVSNEASEKKRELKYSLEHFLENLNLQSEKQIYAYIIRTTKIYLLLFADRSNKKIIGYVDSTGMGNTNDFMLK